MLTRSRLKIKKFTDLCNLIPKNIYSTGIFKDITRFGCSTQTANVAIREKNHWVVEIHKNWDSQILLSNGRYSQIYSHLKNDRQTKEVEACPAQQFSKHSKQG